jgi:FdhE protein
MSHWDRRRRRAEHLIVEQPHAEAQLRFYMAVLDAQQTIHDRLVAGRWRDRQPAATADRMPAVSWVRSLPPEELETMFVELLGRLATSGAATDVVRAECLAISTRDAAHRSALLHAVAGRESPGPSPSPQPDSASTLLALACLQPIAEALVPDQPLGDERQDALCPRCGWPPIAAEIRDDGDTRGRRLLVCMLCASAWPFPRGVCAACGEARSDRIDTHVAESLPHIRVEACVTCRTYLKSIDLRTNGRAVVQADDIASVELDVWATEQGLRKVQTNVLGM